MILDIYDPALLVFCIFFIIALAALILWAETVHGEDIDRAIAKWEVKHGLLEWSVFSDDEIEVPEDPEDVIEFVNNK